MDIVTGMPGPCYPTVALQVLPRVAMYREEQLNSQVAFVCVGTMAWRKKVICLVDLPQCCQVCQMQRNAIHVFHMR